MKPVVEAASAKRNKQCLMHMCLHVHACVGFKICLSVFASASHDSGLQQKKVGKQVET